MTATNEKITPKILEFMNYAISHSPVDTESVIINIHTLEVYNDTCNIFLNGINKQNNIKVDSGIPFIITTGIKKEPTGILYYINLDKFDDNQSAFSYMIDVMTTEIKQKNVDFIKLYQDINNVITTNPDVFINRITYYDYGSYEFEFYTSTKYLGFIEIYSMYPKINIKIESNGNIYKEVVSYTKMLNLIKKVFCNNNT